MTTRQQKAWVDRVAVANPEAHNLRLGEQGGLWFAAADLPGGKTTVKTRLFKKVSRAQAELVRLLSSRKEA